MPDDEVRTPDDEAPAPGGEDEDAGTLGDAATVRGPEDQGAARPD